MRRRRCTIAAGGRPGRCQAPVSEAAAAARGTRSARTWVPDAGRRAPLVDVRLERREVAVELPLRQLHAVLVPLLALQLHVVVEDVVAERAAEEVGARELVDRLAE